MLLAILFTLSQTLLAQPDRFGLPACSAPDQELAARSSFVICHSGSFRAPVWSAYELKAEHLAGPAARPKHFRHDAQLSGASAYDADYRHSGYSRGHLVPAADVRFSAKALRDSFLLSNVVAQKLTVNQGKWRRIENAIRTLAQSADSVIILSGAIYPQKPERIGQHEVAVPSHTFKAVLAITGASKIMYAAIVSNDDAATANYAVTIEELQQFTGYDFFARLDPAEQTKLESTRTSLQP